MVQTGQMGQLDLEKVLAVAQPGAGVFRDADVIIAWRCATAAAGLVADTISLAEGGRQFITTARPSGDGWLPFNIDFPMMGLLVKTPTVTQAAAGLFQCQYIPKGVMPPRFFRAHAGRILSYRGYVAADTEITEARALVTYRSQVGAVAGLVTLQAGTTILVNAIGDSGDRQVPLSHMVSLNKQTEQPGWKDGVNVDEPTLTITNSAWINWGFHPSN